MTGFNLAGQPIAQINGPSGAPRPFTLGIVSVDYDIARFTVSVSGFLGTGYDNVSYTVVPEPAGLGWVVAGVDVGRRGKRG